MKIYLKICAYLSLFFLISCEKTIPIQIPTQDQKLVINCMELFGNSLNIYLSRSASVIDANSDLNVDNAEVLLILDNKDTLQMINKGYGRFLVGNIHTAKTLRITANHVIYGSVEAECIVPAAGFIIEKSYSSTKYSQGMGSSYDVLKFRVKIKDIEGENYYFLQMFTTSYNSYDKPGNSQNSASIWSSDNNLTQITSYTSGLVFDDKTFDAKERTIEYYSENYNFTDSSQVKIVLNSITKSEYLWLKSYEMYHISSGPFSENVQVYSNVKNGFGLFAVYSQTIDSIQVTDLPDSYKK